MIVSQVMASNIAEAIMKKHLDKQEKLYRDLQLFTYEQAKLALGKSLMNAYKKFRPYFDGANTVKVSGKGFSGLSVQVKHDLPSKQGKWVLECSFGDEANEIFFSKYKAWDSVRDANNKLRIELRESLIALRTFKRIQEALPEAVPHLPKSEVRAIIPDLNKLRTKIQTV